MSDVLVSDRGLPLVHLNLYFPGGPAHDPPGKEGLGTLTNRALIRGSIRRSRAEIEEAIEALGTELLTSTQSFAVGLGGSVLSRHLGAFLEHLGEIVTAPAFDPEEVAKTRREMIAQLRSVLDDDAMLGRRWLRQVLFADTRFAHGALGSRESLPDLTVDDVRAHYAQGYARENLVVGASGDVDAGELAALLAPIRAGLPAGDRATWTQAAPAPLPDRAIWLVDKTDRTQSQILVGQPTIAADHPDVLAVHVATTAFGGAFTSRLMQEVRVKRGLSYGAHAQLASERVAGMYLMTAAPEIADTATTVALLLDEYRRFVEEGLTDAEIDFARTHLLHAFAFAVETPTLRAVQQVRAQLLGCPPDHVATYQARLEALDCAQVRAAVRAHLDPDRLAVVVVSTAAEVQAALEGLPGIDRVERRRPWDAPAPLDAAVS